MGSISSLFLTQPNDGTWTSFSPAPTPVRGFPPKNPPQPALRSLTLVTRGQQPWAPGEPAQLSRKSNSIGVGYTPEIFT